MSRSDIEMLNGVPDTDHQEKLHQVYIHTYIHQLVSHSILLFCINIVYMSFK